MAAGMSEAQYPPFLPSSKVNMYRKQATFLHASLAGDTGLLKGSLEIQARVAGPGWGTSYVWLQRSCSIRKESQL